MKVTNKITIHLDDLRRMPPIDVMQGDAYTRQLEFTLYSGGEAWKVPDGVSVAVAYRGASGHGLYDTLPNGTAAYTVSGNVVTVTLIPQVAAVRGDTIVSVLFTDANGKQLATFAVVVRVAFNPAIGAGTPEHYYSIREWVGAGPFQVTLIQSGDGSWVSEDYYDDIRRAYEAKRPMVCLIELTNTEQAWLELPLIKMGNGGVFFFSAVFEGTEWLVTLSRNPEDDGTVVTVETNVHPVTGTTLRDQVTGEIFTLYMDDADLHIVPGGKPTGARDQILLVDRTTGENYTISISNGVPMLESEV